MLILKTRQLVVLTTNKCTAQCEHCVMNASPNREDSLTFTQISTVLDKLCALNLLDVVVFSGGEPMLLGEELLDTIAYADGLGLITRIVTNGYWALSPEKARKNLTELREAGLQEINISADDEHLPYVPFEHVEYIWRASKGMGFRSVVIANSSRPGSRINPTFIMERLGEELPLRFDEHGHQQPLPQPQENGTVYLLSNGTIQHVGRAKEYIDRDKILYTSQEGGCPSALRQPALSPKGYLVACCGIEINHNCLLNIGDIAKHTVEDLILRADNHVILNAIALLGPSFLKRVIEYYAPEVPFFERYASLCQLCDHIFNRPAAVDILLDHCAELSGVILDIRARLEDV